MTLVATACLVAALVAAYCLVATLVTTACLVATLVSTYFLSRHTFWSRHTSCRDIIYGRDILPIATYFPGHDILPVATYFLLRHTFLVATYFLTATCFSSPTCRGHNFFILTRIWACEYSLEISLNVECSHEGI